MHEHVRISSLLACEPVLRAELVCAGDSGNIAEIDALTLRLHARIPKLIRHPEDQSQPWERQWEGRQQ